jgi:hypothetical protein
VTAILETRQMWIEHDAATNAKLRTAPEFYE